MKTNFSPDVFFRFLSAVKPAVQAIVEPEVISDCSQVECQLLLVQNKLKNKNSQWIKWIVVDTNQQVSDDFI